MRLCLTSLLGVIVGLAAPIAARAQPIAVQQPVVGNFSVATSVSVPDRGAALLGGVGSAASGRSTYGPLRSGSSLGFSRESSSASAHVYIHDFVAMDEALLNTPTTVQTSRLEPRISDRLTPRRRPHDIAATSSPTFANVAAEAERLAEQATARGKFAVARLHWQRAARHGSTRAVQRLAEPSGSAASR